MTLGSGRSGTAQNFQWIETLTGELVLMSSATNRILRIDPQSGAIRADSPGPIPDDSDGARSVWSAKGRRGQSAVERRCVSSGAWENQTQRSRGDQDRKRHSFRISRAEPLERHLEQETLLADRIHPLAEYVAPLET